LFAGVILIAMSKRVIHYRKLYQELENRILSGFWADKLPSQSQLTAEFQVSHNTIKKVIDQLKNSGLVAGHQGKGVYVVERNSSPAVLVGIWMRHLGVLSVPFYSRVTESIRQDLPEYHAEVEFFTDFESINMQRYCGLILYGQCPDNVDMENLAANFHGRIVQVNHNFAPQLPAVYSNNLYCGYMAIEHLYKNGHRNIAVLTRDTNLGNNIFCYRWQGAEKFAAEHPDVKLLKTEIDPSMLQAIPCQASEIAVKKLLDTTENITAVFAFNDVIALGVLSALQQRHLKVPDDISIISVDARDFSQFTNPPLTTFNENAEKIAKTTVKMLFGDLNGSRQLTIEPRLVERASIKNIS